MFIPPARRALEWGANVVVVETGAVPRNDAECSAEWQGFTVADAKQLFRDAWILGEGLVE